MNPIISFAACLGRGRFSPSSGSVPLSSLLFGLASPRLAFGSFRLSFSFLSFLSSRSKFHLMGGRRGLRRSINQNQLVCECNRRYSRHYSQAFLFSCFGASGGGGGDGMLPSLDTQVHNCFDDATPNHWRLSRGSSQSPPGIFRIYVEYPHGHRRFLGPLLPLPRPLGGTSTEKDFPVPFL
ncbi:hypothetical protein BC826DRAFT_1041086 [Russula brevipes]|nr:hypothetical protein BC826DRAFT_1041086 [Russula brevipes]